MIWILLYIVGVIAATEQVGAFSSHIKRLEADFANTLTKGQMDYIRDTRKGLVLRMFILSFTSWLAFAVWYILNRNNRIQKHKN